MSADGYTGPDAALLRARDNALCTCGHKCVSHGSYLDGAFIGVGAGPCGFDHLIGAESVKHCERFEAES